MIDPLQSLPDDVLNRAVQGRNLVRPLLRENLREGATLLAFLRHFG